ncbi:MAG: hypothetical protein LBJ07_04105 [Actinomycetes bacterium]|jgi:hypothetical protein|nr:hypothetical protein [Actinomycetes bacterium]
MLGKFKVSVALVSALLIVCTPGASFAADPPATVTAPTTITLGATQTSFQLPLTVTSSQPYAGAEFALNLPATISLTSVRYTPVVAVTGQAGTGQAGPTPARGLHWFSYFSGANSFTGTLQAIVTLTYTGSASTQLTIDHAEVMTLGKAEVISTMLATNKIVTITRTAPPSNPQPPTPANAGNTTAPTPTPASSTKKAPTAANLNIGIPNGDTVNVGSLMVALTLVFLLTAVTLYATRKGNVQFHE